MVKRPLNNYADSLLIETRGSLRRFGLRARKGLGQHFLVGRDVLEVILEAAELTPGDIVVEVGPGLGILTRELAKNAGRVISVELDEKLVTILRKELSSLGNVSVVGGDILKIAPEDLLQKEKIESPGYKVVANLPYYITSPVLRHFLEAGLKPGLMVLMVQKEVAEAIVAQPGGMSLLSLSVQLYGQPKIVGLVPADRFYPKPEVSSAILKIELYPRPAVEVGDIDGFFELVRAGFSSPRKQIVNSLMHGLKLPKVEVLTLLGKAEILPERRAESLSLEEWQRLFETFIRSGEKGC